MKKSKQKRTPKNYAAPTRRTSRTKSELATQKKSNSKWAVKDTTTMTKSPVPHQLRRAKSIVTKPNLIVWLWIILILSGIALHALSAERSGTFAENTSVEIQYDHQADPEEIKPLLENAQIDAKGIEIIGGNTLRFRTNSSPDQVKDSLASLSDNAGVISHRTGKTVGYDVVMQYLPGLISTIVIGGIVSLFVVTFSMRKASIYWRLRTWSVFYSLVLLPIIALAAIGTIISQTQILSLTRHTLELYLVICAAWLVTLVYSFSITGLRSKILSYFRFKQY